MPGFDGTDPRGMGPMTGGGRGVCNPYGPLRAGGYAPTGYWPRPAMPTFGAAYPQATGYASGVYGFGRGVWPQMMGGATPFPVGTGGFGRSLGMGRGRGMRGRRGGRSWGW